MSAPILRGSVFLFSLLFSSIGVAEEPASDGAASALVYPEARMGTVVDTYHGVEVPDPYRWMEDPDGVETREWVEAQVDVTTEWLEAVPRRSVLAERLTKLWNYERYSSPSRKGGKYFFSHNNGLQNHSVLYSSDSLNGPARVILDPNTLSKDGTVSVSLTSVSEDASLMVYGTSDGGSDWKTLHIRQVASNRNMTETLHWVKFSGASWTHDNNGFFYSRYPEPTSELESVNENQKLYYHQIGTPQDQDKLIYARPDDPKLGFGASVNESGTTLYIYGWKGTDDRNLLYSKDLTQEDSEIVSVIDTFEASYSVVHDAVLKDQRSWFERLFGPKITETEHRVWVKTNKDAPNGKLVAFNPKQPDEANWITILPSSDNVLDDVSIVGGKIVATYLQDARSVAKIFELDGTYVRDVDLPGIGSVWGFGGKSTDVETFYGFTGFTSPTTIYQYNMDTGATHPWKSPEVDFDPKLYEAKQVFYESKDGTKVPMFIMHKKGLELNGKQPTILYGYGGFNISLTPSFSLSRLVWMEMGGVYAIANLRGGGEYGENWHKAGTKMNKQNVFDDFIGAAEYLIEEGYTAPEKLAIKGGSNGGLLVGACMLQRPELFAAAIPAVGVLDMLRYHKFTIGWAWADDYGTSEDSPEMFNYLKNYSPVHNLKAGTQYPSTMIVTADHDDRVVPAHSFKFAAALQKAHEGPNPVLIRIETRAGHGGGTPVTKRIEQYADEYAFLVRSLGMETPEELGEVTEEDAELETMEEAAK